MNIFSFYYFRQRQHIGFIDDSHQPSGSANRLIVSSRNNVVASLDLSSRKIGKYLSLIFYFVMRKRKRRKIHRNT